MASFERKVNYTIDFEKPILIKHPAESLVSYSTKILKESIMRFNTYIESATILKVVFISFRIDKRDFERFKELTVSDIKNIIYNTVIDAEGGY